MNVFMRAVFLALASIALLPAQGIAAARPVSAEDLFKLNYPGSPQISPDGKWVVFVNSKMNGPEDRYDTNLWVVSANGGRPRQLTATGRDNSPVWAPDSSRFVFVRSEPKKRPQIFEYNFRTGRIHKLTAIKGGAGGPQYSNNGKLIAFSVTTVDAQPKAHINFAAAGFKPKKTQLKSDVRDIDTMHFQANGAGEVYQYHQHIWIMNADGSHQRALTSGHEWSEGGPSFSPDDKTLAFNSLRHDDPYTGPTDIYTIPVSGGSMHKVPATEVASNLVGYGHTNDRIWYLSQDVKDPAESGALVWSNPDGSGRTEVIGKNKVSWGDALLADMKEGGGFCLNVTPDDKFMIMNVDGPGYAKLVKVSTADGTMTDLTSANGEAYGCTTSADGKTVAYAFSDFMHPPEIYVLKTESPQPHALTALNGPWLQTVALSKPQEITVKDTAGYDVQGWFMPAVGKSGKRPTILNIHGGPETQFGNTFFHELQYLAGLGYNVVFTDPRGSAGHGYDFEEALVHHWGDAMFEDTSLAVDEVSKRSDVDTNRLGVMGGSYGGYATLWVISHTDRYKAAIGERVVSNLMSEQLTADFASTNGLGGPYDWGMPWDPNNALMAQSPLTYADKVHTPLLLLHGTEDTRTPFAETMQEFSALKILGRNVHYVEFPGENHDLSRTGSPVHRVERLHILGDWMNKYLKP